MTSRPARRERLRPGFPEPVLDSQKTFRLLLDAMARPGRLTELPLDLEPPACLDRAAAAVCLTLLDHETPLWLQGIDNGEEIEAYLRFHCGCPFVDEPARAAFALVAGPLPDFETFAQGSDRYPDRSASLIWQVESLSDEGSLELTGPGIEVTRRLGIAPLPPSFLEAWQANRALFPRGLDLIITAGQRLTALPRTTEITELQPCT